MGENVRPFPFFTHIHSHNAINITNFVISRPLFSIIYLGIHINYYYSLEVLVKN